MVLQPESSVSEGASNINYNGAHGEKSDKGKGKKNKKKRKIPDKYSHAGLSVSSREGNQDNLSKKKRKNLATPTPKVEVTSSDYEVYDRKEWNNDPNDPESSPEDSSASDDEEPSKSRLQDTRHKRKSKSKPHKSSPESSTATTSERAGTDPSHASNKASAPLSPQRSQHLQADGAERASDVPLSYFSGVERLDASPSKHDRSSPSSSQDVRADTQTPLIQEGELTPDEQQEFIDFLYSGAGTPGSPPTQSVLYAKKFGSSTSIASADSDGDLDDEARYDSRGEGRDMRKSSGPLSIISSASSLSDHVPGKTSGILPYFTGDKATAESKPASAYVSHSSLTQHLSGLLGTTAGAQLDTELPTPEESLETEPDPMEADILDFKLSTHGRASAVVGSLQKLTRSASRHASPARRARQASSPYPEASQQASYTSRIPSAEEINEGIMSRPSTGANVVSAVPFPLNRSAPRSQCRWSPPSQSSLRTLVNDIPAGLGQHVSVSRLHRTSGGGDKSRSPDVRQVHVSTQQASPREKTPGRGALSGASSAQARAAAAAASHHRETHPRLGFGPDRFQSFAADSAPPAQPEGTPLPLHWLVVPERDASQSSVLNVWASRSINGFRGALGLGEYLLFRLLSVWFISTFISCLKQQMLQRYHYYDSTNFDR